MIFSSRGTEGDNGIETVAKLGGEGLFHRLLEAARLGVAEADRIGAHLPGAGIAGHDQHHVAEIGFFAVVVGQGAVIHDLQQDTEQVRMGFFDFVEQQHGIGILDHGVGEQPALVEADVAGRRADQPGHRMLLHVLAHVEAEELDPELGRQLLGHLGFADPGRAGEEEGADRLFRVPQTGPGAQDRAAQGVDGRILPEDLPLEVAVEMLQPSAVGGGDAARRDAGDGGDHRFDIGRLTCRFSRGCSRR